MASAQEARYKVIKMEKSTQEDIEFLQGIQKDFENKFGTFGALLRFELECALEMKKDGSTDQNIIEAIKEFSEDVFDLDESDLKDLEEAVKKLLNKFDSLNSSQT